jgi:non-ribosomal peptide synthetase component F
LFEEQVEARAGTRLPSRFGKEELSYRELNVRANKLARYLRRLGVGPKYSSESLQIVRWRCWLVIRDMKAGGAYLPLDPEYPPERIGFMIENLASAGGLHAERSSSSPSDTAALSYLPSLQTSRSSLMRAVKNLQASAAPDNLALCHLHVRPRAGRPKGVLVAHRG